ncbi:hypothetical protein JTE90_006054 [Oedothorax gibbosus]|uniref:Uncharacterized protein n=1 Tax=Oedothorax gibbosus TaxID=931172 RepID=A0AAV6V4D0_9ARAC|nr:hypothetical protein JTE90_006054 [Oedothorax gibbosus]
MISQTDRTLASAPNLFPSGSECARSERPSGSEREITAPRDEKEKGKVNGEGKTSLRRTKINQEGSSRLELTRVFELLLRFLCCILVNLDW